MQTLVDMLERATKLQRLNVVTGGPLDAYKSKTKIQVPGESGVVLPSDPKGLSRLHLLPNVENLSPEDSRVARLSLLRTPGIVFPMLKPLAEELQEMGKDSTKFRSEKPRRLGSGICVLSDEVTSLYGVAQVTVLENGLRMGSSELIEYVDQWTRNLDDAEDLLFCMIRRTNENLVPASPEPRAPAWKKVVILLGGVVDSSQLPRDWIRQMKLAAGLHRVHLEVQLNPESAKSKVIKDLRSNPPDALLVWADWVPSPEAYTVPYLAAREGVIAEVLGSAGGLMVFEEALEELLMHIRQIAPLVAGLEASSDSDPKLSWKDAAVKMLNMSGDHLVLTERAQKRIPKNSYVDVSRMFEFYSKLSSLASEYHQNSGQLSGRLADYAMANYGIEIAMGDKKLNGVSASFEGGTYPAGPHVKVDDDKSADRCGRIYFSIDEKKYRFIVDHVGLHDYP